MARRPVLVVEDDPAIRALVVETLTFEGYAVVTASDGAEAIEAIERQRPCLVLLDMRMPRLDGWGVARVLRERQIVIPIVVMAAALSAHTWGAEIGAVDYLAKPFELDDLMSKVARHCAAA